MAIVEIGQQTTLLKKEFLGLSTDSKSTTCAAGSKFTETDTGNIYIYDGSSWTTFGGGSFTVAVAQTRPNDTTAYAANDVHGADPASNLSFASIGTAGKTIVITDLQMEMAINAIPSGMAGFRLHLYNAAPTAITDNLAFNLIAADRAKYLGSIFIPIAEDLGDTLIARVTGVNLFVKLVTSTLYGVVETLSAYTPSAQSVRTITLTALEV